MHSATILRAVVLLMNYHGIAEKLKAAYGYINNDNKRVTR